MFSRPHCLKAIFVLSLSFIFAQCDQSPNKPSVLPAIPGDSRDARRTYSQICAELYPIIFGKQDDADRGTRDNVVEATELQELRVDLLADELDNAQTVMGRWSIARTLLKPTANEQRIAERQSTLKKLIADPELMDQLQKELARVKNSEMQLKTDKEGIQSLFGLYSYWIGRGRYWGAVENLLYWGNPFGFCKNIPLVGPAFFKSADIPINLLNNHTLTLEGAWFYKAFKNILQLSAMLGIKEAALRLVKSDAQGKERDSFGLLNALMGGVVGVFRGVWPRPLILKNIDYDAIVRTDPRGAKAIYDQCIFQGSAYDYYKAVARGCRPCTPSNASADGSLIEPQRFAIQDHNSHPVRLLWRKLLRGVTSAVSLARSCLVELLYSVVIRESLPCPLTDRRVESENISFSRKAPAVFFAAAHAALTLFFIASEANDIRGTMRILHRCVNDLREHLKIVADCINAMKALVQCVSANALFLENQEVAQKIKEAQKALGHSSVKKLCDILSTATFADNTSLLFSRGRVLMAHRLLSEVKNALLPLMRLVGEIDAYCGIASLVRDTQKNNARFCFAEFLNGDDPHIELKGFWTPVLNIAGNQVATNDFYLGGSYPTAALFTGPNGGGKSTVLQSLGHAVLCAQSWGIVPAQAARMTMLSGMRTCFDPREDVKKKLSKFMASQAGMARIDALLTDKNTRKKLVLVDEPYSGTVDDEMAERTSEFCNRVITGNSLAIIATHVKPVLQQSNKFGLHHVKIAIHEDKTKGKHVFERTFRITPGLCNWWFDDKQLRREYINQLNAQS